MEQFLRIGSVTQPHGVHGELKVYTLTDDPRRFGDLEEVILEKGPRRETKAIEQVRYFKNMVLLKLEGIDDMDEANRFRSWDIIIPREKGVPLKENEYYTADLIGISVFTEDGKQLGTLKDVIKTGANDVYSVQSDEYGEVLIPAVKACIIDVDVTAARMTVHLLPCLIDEKRR